MADSIIFKHKSGSELKIPLYKSARGLRIEAERPVKVKLDIDSDLDYDEVCKLIQYLELAVLPQLTIVK